MTLAELRKLDENGLEYKTCQICEGKVHEYSRWQCVGTIAPPERLYSFAECEDCKDVTKAWSDAHENK